MQGVEHPLNPVLEDIWNVAQGVTVREKVPAAGAVAVVVQPRAEDEVCGDGEEETSRRCVSNKYGHTGEKNSHDDHPSEKSPVTGAVLPTLVIVAGKPRLPIQLEQILIILRETEALEFKTATTSRIALISAFHRIVSCAETLQSGSVRIALEIDLGARILGLCVVVVAPVFTAAQHDTDALHVLVDGVQARELGILGPSTSMVESNDREAELGATVAVLRFFVYKAAD